MKTQRREGDGDMDISKLPIETDEKMKDNEGRPLKSVQIYPHKLVCHPKMKAQLETGLKLMKGSPMSEEEMKRVYK